MNHITDYFKKFTTITDAGKSKKRTIVLACTEYNIPVVEDAVEIKGGYVRIFCTAAQAAHLKQYEQKLIESCRSKKIFISRIIPVMVA